MTHPESMSNSKFQPLNPEEAAMIFGGAAAQDTYEERTTTLSDGTQKQDLVKYDSIGQEQPGLS